jgi:hypothetical protein
LTGGSMVAVAVVRHSSTVSLTSRSSGDLTNESKRAHMPTSGNCNGFWSC